MQAVRVLFGESGRLIRCFRGKIRGRELTRESTPRRDPLRDLYNLIRLLTATRERELILSL